MILYPTTIFFQATRAIQKATERLRAGQPLDKDKAVDMKEFQRVVDLAHWLEIEKKLGDGTAE